MLSRPNNGFRANAPPGNSSNSNNVSETNGKQQRNYSKKQKKTGVTARYKDIFTGSMVT